MAGGEVVGSGWLSERCMIYEWEVTPPC